MSLKPIIGTDDLTDAESSYMECFGKARFNYSSVNSYILLNKTFHSMPKTDTELIREVSKIGVNKLVEETPGGFSITLWW